jgi:hypothetical protein
MAGATADTGWLDRNAERLFQLASDELVAAVGARADSSCCHVLLNADE